MQRELQLLIRDTEQRIIALAARLQRLGAQADLPPHLEQHRCAAVHQLDAWLIALQELRCLVQDATGESGATKRARVRCGEPSPPPPLLSDTVH